MTIATNKEGCDNSCNKLSPFWRCLQRRDRLPVKLQGSPSPSTPVNFHPSAYRTTVVKQKGVILCHYPNHRQTVEHFAPTTAQVYYPDPNLVYPPYHPHSLPYHHIPYPLTAT